MPSTDADLDAIVADGRQLDGRVLWCGTGGLAGALAGRRPVPRPALAPPILALIGSDHPVSREQVAAVPSDRRAAVVVCDLPAATDRESARRQICTAFAALLQRVPAPERCSSAAARRCATCARRWACRGSRWTARWNPAFPTSVLRGGAWDGQRLVSKSGAFGDIGFLARLLGEMR